MKIKPKWTIGIPCYDQPGTLWATIIGLRTMHAEQMPDCEILVVNDNPESAAGKIISEQVPKMNGPDIAGIRCVESRPSFGTYAARNRIFDEADGDFVLCMDSHVFIALGGLASLFEYFDANSLSRDLVSGPVLYSNLRTFGTHYNPGFRGGMWGMWGQDQRANARVPMNILPGGEPFEIDGMGIGLFACRRDTFPRFNEAFRGFGGGEWYIHEKNRQQGGRSVCLPDLRWPHYFWRESKAYPNNWFDRVRNEVIGRQELGFPVDDVREHFVEGDQPKISREDWDWILADPIGHQKPKCKGCGPKTAKTPPENSSDVQGTRVSGIATNLSNRPGDDLEGLYRFAASNPSDINKHCPKLRELASRSRSVVELGVRRGVSTTALLAGQPEHLTAFDLRPDPVVDRLAAVAGKTKFRFIQGDSRKVTIPDCDLLFIDTVHTAEQLTDELRAHSSRCHHWIAFHDTATYGEVGEGKKTGLLVALREFLFANPQWSVVYHSTENNGLTVISCDDRDKPKLPHTVELVGNLAKAVVGYVASGLQDRTAEQVRECLEVCALCDQRRGASCAVCGCPVADRARMASNDCPLAKWPKYLDQ